MDTRPDHQLLAAYVHHRDEKAFAVLVRRHQHMVYSACLRKMGRSPLAEDAVQLAFLLLAGRARQLQHHGCIGGWLYKTALYQAANLMRKEQHRHQLHAAFAQDQSPQTLRVADGHAGQTDITPHLDEALLTLRDDDREAVLLRFFAGHSLREVGNALGTTEEAARKRVNRALDRLAEALRRRGVKTASAAALGLMLAQTTCAAPPGLFDNVMAGVHGTALAAQAGSAGIGWVKTGIAAVALLAVGVPVAWQWQEQRRLRHELHALRKQMETAVPSVIAAAPSGAPVPSPLERPGALSLALAQPGNHLMSLLTGMWAMESRDSLQARLALWRGRLNLDGPQMEAVTRRLQQAQQERQTMVQAMADGAVEFDRVMSFLQADLHAVQDIRRELDEQQTALLGPLLEEEARQRAENLAHWRLADMNTALHLNEAQQQRVFQELTACELAHGPARMPAMKSFADLLDWLEKAGQEERRRLRGILTEPQYNIYREQAANARAGSWLFSR